MSIYLKIKKLRIEKKLSQKEFSALFKIDSSQYSKIELGKLNPTLALLMEICSLFNVTMDWLCFDRKYENIEEDQLILNEDPVTYIKSKIPVNHKNGIPVVPFDAFAGVGDADIKGIDFDAIEERYLIPLFEGLKIDFMIPVRGSSMYPKYSSGDVVACRLIDELLFVQWNKVYVIDSKTQGIMMKRLKKSDREDCMICKSDNHDYGEFELPKKDIRKIALVVGVIRLE